MYIDQAMKRLKKIDWNKIHTQGDCIDGDLFWEFLRRLAIYFKKINNTGIASPMFRTYQLFCHDNSIPIQFSEIFEKLPQNELHPKHIVWCYIQAALDIDAKKAQPEDLAIFEPLLCIFERGGGIQRGDCSSSITITNAYYIPLPVSWYVKSLERPPFDLFAEPQDD